MVVVSLTGLLNANDGVCNPVGDDSTGFVLVDHPGNPPDPKTGCGKVDYPFEISRYEVTNEQYAEFLNAVARYGDSKGLYSELMEQHFFGGIRAEVRDGQIHYSVKPGYARLPVTFVSWFDAIRYANWLHFGRPNSGHSVLGTTEGNATVGAYDTSELERLGNSANIRRNVNALYWIPNCNEWIKAGFYDYARQDYWEFATGSDKKPSASAPTDRFNSANFYSERWAAPFPHLTEVGSYSGSGSSFGTFDQAGNAMEWVEDRNGSGRMALGGSLVMYESALRRTYRDSEMPDQKLATFGFRVARTPQAIDPVGTATPRPLMNPDPVGPSKKAILPAATAVPDVHDNGHNETDMVFVKVGYPGNDKDPLYGHGCVPYSFEIGKYEITNRQYADFLNAVASKSDPFRLFHEDMQSGVVGGIVRRKNGDEFVYSAKPGWEERPVTYLSWYMLARMANWYHYGNPRTGRSELGTTEGNDSHGAYDTRSFPTTPGAIVEFSKLPDRRNPGARYWIPSNDEWYKAAYFDPLKPGVRKYWDYPLMTDNAPNNSAPPGDRNTANYQTTQLGIGEPWYVARVNDYPYAASFFGVQGMAGNVWEWIEDWRSQGRGKCWRCDEWTRGLRGGSFNYSYLGLHALNLDPGDPAHGYFVYGGRLARASSDEMETAAEASCARLDSIFRNLTPRAAAVYGMVVGVGASLLTGLTVFGIRRYGKSQRIG
ncbi:formylglycine-generating enzyme family protein [Methylocaldum szegediense]|nr:SUMF1/EgtB/PvdO family nonheme iron enzyme [Methylocaldum szegediense]